MIALRPLKDLLRFLFYFPSSSNSSLVFLAFSPGLLSLRRLPAIGMDSTAITYLECLCHHKSLIVTLIHRHIRPKPYAAATGPNPGPIARFFIGWMSWRHKCDTCGPNAVVPNRNRMPRLVIQSKF